jgi:hypothetical protein
MGLVNQRSQFMNRCLASAHCFNSCVGRETEVSPAGHLAGLRGGVGGTFSQEQ